MTEKDRKKVLELLSGICLDGRCHLVDGADDMCRVCYARFILEKEPICPEKNSTT
jgi:hypothetical protein